MGENNVKKKYRIRRIIAFAVLLAVAAGACSLFFGRNSRRAAHKAAVDSLSMDPADDAAVNSTYQGTSYRGSGDGGTFEYGTAVIDPLSLVGRHTGELTVVKGSDIDTSVIGEYDITYRLSCTDEYGSKAVRDIVRHYSVEDTAAPEIEIRYPIVTLFTGENFDPLQNVLSARDPVDGDVECSADADIDTERAGSYSVRVTAKDRNGNETSAEYTVDIDVFAPAVTPSDGVYNYAVRINRAANTITVYKRDDRGQYTIPYKAMVCSTGDATPLGTFYTYDDPSNSKWSPRYPWWSLYGGVYGMYATGITGAILFHSVPYYSPNQNDLEYGEYNKLGTAASMGCVRLAVRDVMWIFSHCPKGTMVEFYDDADDPGPLGKPEPVHIDTSSPNRGWDPTDPDPANPWHTGQQN